MAQHPLIPKRLAAKIRSAQEKVKAARYSIIYDDERSAQDSLRVAEYEADPASFARRYYSNNSFDSYPVQTNISRCREGLERRRARRVERIEDLAGAEAHLKLVEDQVLQAINRLRPGTPGRVPWPRALRSLEKLRHIESLINERAEREYRRQRAIDGAEFEAQGREEERQARLEDDAFHQQWQEQLAKMPQEERDAAKVAARRIKEALESGEITAAQIIDYLRSRGGAA